MKPVEDIRRDNLIALIAERGNQRKLADAIKKAPAQISQWITRAPNSGTGKPRVISGEVAREIELRLGKPRGWMDHEHEMDFEQDGQSEENSPIPMFTQERRADDNVTALQIAVRVLASALLPKSQGAATEFLSALKALCSEKRFSPDHYLLGALSDIAEQVQIDEAKVAQEQSHANTAHRKKPST